MLFHAALVAASATIAAAVTSLEVKGNRFVNPSTGEDFQIVGAAYQPGGSSGYDPTKGLDPLSNGDVCMRDAALMQVLGVNTIRVYNLDPDLNHDACASIFNAAGMYMLIDVNSPLVGESLNSAEPWTSYYAAYLNRTFAIVEAFKDYPNLLGFFSGNEVIETVEQGGTAPPYVRAVTRDLKNYIKNHASRTIPVGYSAADVRPVLNDTYNYFACSINGEDDDMSRADMFALNSYSWCGNSSFTESTYDQLVAMFAESSLPVFFSEYGCIKPAPRVFTEVGAIYSTEMTWAMTGAVVYEYAQEANDYGLVQINNDSSAQLLADFRTLQNQYSTIDWKTVQATKDPNNSTKPLTCSSKLILEKGFNNNFTLPVPPPGAQDIIDKGVSPAPKGKIISISDYSVKYTVKDVDGSVISGLAVKPLANGTSNTSGSNTASGSGTTTSGSASPTSSNKNAASRPVGLNSASIALPIVIAGFFALGASLI